jgi:hypothetical protein
VEVEVEVIVAQELQVQDHQNYQNLVDLEAVVVALRTVQIHLQ